MDASFVTLEDLGITGRLATILTAADLTTLEALEAFKEEHNSFEKVHGVGFSTAIQVDTAIRNYHSTKVEEEPAKEAVEEAPEEPQKEAVEEAPEEPQEEENVEEAPEEPQKEAVEEAPEEPVEEAAVEETVAEETTEDAKAEAPVEEEVEEEEPPVVEEITVEEPEEPAKPVPSTLQSVEAARRQLQAARDRDLYIRRLSGGI